MSLSWQDKEWLEQQFLSLRINQDWFEQQFQSIRNGILNLRHEINQVKQGEEMDAATIQAKLSEQAALIASNGDAAASANALLVTIHDLLVANVGDPVALQAIADAIDANDKTIGSTSDSLVAAVLANTVVASAPFVQKMAEETWVDAQTRLWIYNEHKPVDQQAQLPATEEEWNNLPVG